MEKEDCLLKSDSKTILESPLPMKRKLFRRFKEFNFVIEPKEKISIVGEEQAKKMGKKYCQAQRAILIKKSNRTLINF